MCRHYAKPTVGLLLILLTGLPAAAQRVIQVSVDGLHAGQLRGRMIDRPDDFPNFWRLVREGSSTFDARNDYFSSFTLPNHVTMLTGRPVLNPGEDPTVGHGYTTNGTPARDATLHTVGNENVDYVASVFDVLHDRGYATGLYATKTKFSIFQQSYNRTEQTPGGRTDQYLENGDQGSDKIDQFVVRIDNGTSSSLVTQLIEDMTDDPLDFALVHLLEPDSIGHAFGWQTPEWDQALSLVDQHLGRILDFVETDARFSGQTTLIVTGDHGGLNLHHDRVEDPNVYRIPMFAWGAGVAVGEDLYDLNRYVRDHPGSRRIDYREAAQPIRNGELANLALTLFDLPPVDGSTINVAQDLVLDRPQMADWQAEAADAGEPGNGTHWRDARNWSRAGVQDRPARAGDYVRLLVNSELSLIDLQGARRIGSLRVDGDYRLTNGDLIVHSGDVLLATGVVLQIDGSLSSPEGLVLSGSGEATIRGGTNDLMIRDATVNVLGTVSGSVAVRGEFSPGDVVGQLAVREDVVMAGSGLLRFDIAGAADNAFDRLTIADAATLRGTIELQPTAEYTDPERGEFHRFNLLSARRRFGRFSTVRYDGQELPIRTSRPRVHVGDGLFRSIQYDVDGQGASVEWINYRALPGDVDGDGAFQTKDLIAVFDAATYEDGENDNADWTTGDWNGDRDFTSSDLIAAFETARFEQPSLLPATLAVPEPSLGPWLTGIVYLVVCLCGRTRCRRVLPDGTAAC